uniref:Uncharacterized protein n=1 Tax=Trypanosoma congolense (strain IL3000) TaxID=1068625 RepID=G0UU02_TRYCI|nr:conserved hypothetical protein [Trypanosoma congolense IL3000]
MDGFESFLLTAAERAPFLVGDVVEPSEEKEQEKPERNGGEEILQRQGEGENIATIQRLLVDGPLQPLGLEHSLYHTLFPAFTGAMEAARDVWRMMCALQDAESKAGTADVEKASAAGEATSNAAGSGDVCVLHDVESLRNSLSAAKTVLSERQKALDNAHAKMRSLVLAVVQYEQKQSGAEGTSSEALPASSAELSAGERS